MFIMLRGVGLIPQCCIFFDAWCTRKKLIARTYLVKNRRMITAGENQKAAIKLLYHARGKLADFKLSKEELTKELSGLLNKEEDEIKIPGYTLIRRKQKQK